MASSSSSSSPYSSLPVAYSYWPFMFDYVEVTMPPPDWDTIALVGWFMMQSAVTFLAHATHIQFLTLLFPSSLERKLIIAFLGPLCVFASAMYFTNFLPDPNMQDLGDAIRNTATSTLSLLYTSGLLIWGCAVNRKRAWDQEGGTFGFGVISITLAFIGTATNFVEVKEDRLRWLPWLVNTVLLWQSWTGFWWWVGAGMWTGEVVDLEMREERQRRREEKRIKKKAKMLNILIPKSQSNLAVGTRADPTSTADNGPKVNSSPISSRTSVFSTRRRRRGLGTDHTRTNEDSEIEMDNLELTRVDSRNPNAASSSVPQRTHTAPTEISSSSPSNDSSHGILSAFNMPDFIDRWFGRLSAAHNAAAKKQARTAGEMRQTEQVKKWGIGAMTERVISEQSRRSSAVPNLSGHSRSSRAAREKEDEDEEEDEDGWISDREREAGPSGSCHQQRIEHRQGFGDPPDLDEERRNRNRNRSESKSWKDRLMKARLRDVTHYD
ncbi:uncharacterized protein MELLADRAFT_77765 [Melampsora larici-populina 98AG31]|uniref:Uncharacterized protein n=1 Tax=Melampsora larici-populina (strain 98AG31 / pathotype 3-4-7) TaxID=747676 RepID=F4RLL4_MELLP|nr:uncharacterized protein MELLADRAFT_77765 [Melampsora larici-populina 98AG31]EGG06728.1 hypothetical protein MELLADRAFT_77765 [Melampsora larici-populina 98AG31]